MTVRLGVFTIRRKLVLITMLTCTVALAVACGVFATYEVVMFQRGMVLELSLQADLITANSAAALAFDDVSAATETLATLTTDSDTVRALLYGKDGRVFASYRRADAEFDSPVPIATRTQRFSRDRLVLWRPVAFRREEMGTLYLESDLSELRKRLYAYAGIVAIVMVGTGLIAFVLSSRLQRIISEPIGALVETASTISTRHDYSLRVPNRHRDEIGVLIEGFNEMLSQIEQRDHALVKAQDELEDRVEERTAELRDEIAEREQAQAEAESATHAKSAFLANVSHEIRTPINVIIGMTDMALDGELPVESRNYLNTLRRATLGLLAIVNDILDSSKITAGKVTMEAVDVSLRSVVAEVDELLAPQARAKGLALECAVDADIPEHVRADPNRLKQVLVNLTANAIKFTETGGVTVGFRVLERAATQVRVRGTVRDTGIGIPADRRTAIFESFTQADDSTTRTHGGTGLGLSISRQLIELMGGRIGVESEVGQGSTFWFEITLALVADDEETSRARSAYA